MAGNRFSELVAQRVILSGVLADLMWGGGLVSSRTSS